MTPEIKLNTLFVENTCHQIKAQLLKRIKLLKILQIKQPLENKNAMDTKLF